MRRIVAGTRNAGKISEIRTALADLPVEVIGLPDANLPDVEETGTTFKENALLKARYYCQQTGEYCLADDSGLEVDALAGAPGVYSARYAGKNATDADNNKKLLQDLKDVPEEARTARFRCVLALVGLNDILMCADGVCEGLILTEPRGTGGFGYDSLFWLPELQKTLAEISVAEKNAVSHRGKALTELKAKLAQYLASNKT